MTTLTKCSSFGHETGHGHGEGCQHGIRPKYVRYNGFAWHCVYSGPFVVLHIIGFENRHTLKDKLCRGEMETDGAV